MARSSLVLDTGGDFEQGLELVLPRVVNRSISKGLRTIVQEATRRRSTQHRQLLEARLEYARRGSRYPLDMASTNRMQRGWSKACGHRPGVPPCTCNEPDHVNHGGGILPIVFVTWTASPLPKGPMFHLDNAECPYCNNGGSSGELPLGRSMDGATQRRKLNMQSILLAAL